MSKIKKQLQNSTTARGRDSETNEHNKRNEALFSINVNDSIYKENEYFPGTRRAAQL